MGALTWIVMSMANGEFLRLAATVVTGVVSYFALCIMLRNPVCMEYKQTLLRRENNDLRYYVRRIPASAPTFNTLPPYSTVKPCSVQSHKPVCPAPARADCLNFSHNPIARLWVPLKSRCAFLRRGNPQPSCGLVRPAISRSQTEE